MADPFITELKREVVLKPDDPAPRFRLAEALFAEGQFDSAARQLQKVIELSPEDGNARRMYAIMRAWSVRSPGVNT